MPLDKKKLIVKCKALPMCNICKKCITVAELMGQQFEAVQERDRRMAYYHTTCMGMEAGGHD